MIKLSLIIAFLFTTAFAYSQHDKVVVGEFCYYEQIDGQKSNGDAMPYTYHSRLELKFKSGYQISINNMDSLLAILEGYSSNSSTSKTLLGEFKPETISKGTKIIDMKSSLQVFLNPDNLIFEIPKLTDMFGGDVAPNHTIFIPIDCIPKLISCLKK